MGIICNCFTYQLWLSTSLVQFLEEVSLFSSIFLWIPPCLGVSWPKSHFGGIKGCLPLFCACLELLQWNQNSLGVSLQMNLPSHRCVKSQEVVLCISFYLANLSLHLLSWNFNQCTWINFNQCLWMNLIWILILLYNVWWLVYPCLSLILSQVFICTVSLFLIISTSLLKTFGRATQQWKILLNLQRKECFSFFLSLCINRCLF